MSRWLDFYRGEGIDEAGRTLAAYWAFSDDEMEVIHDFIQWMFPLREPSRFNPNAPRLTDRDITEFQSDPRLRANLLRSLDRFLGFLGLERSGGEVVKSARFSARRQLWSHPNHNWLRVTRVLHSLRLLGLDAEAQAVFTFLKSHIESGESGIDSGTFRYWRDAATSGRAGPTGVLPGRGAC